MCNYRGILQLLWQHDNIAIFIPLFSPTEEVTEKLSSVVLLTYAQKKKKIMYPINLLAKKALIHHEKKICSRHKHLMSELDFPKYSLINIF